MTFRFRTLLLTLFTAWFAFVAVGISTPALAQAAETGIVKGQALDSEGNGLSGVTMTMTGPAKYVTQTRTDGTYEIDNVKPGIYTVFATLSGYQTAEQTDVAVVAGATQSLNVSLAQQTLTSLQEIGRVRVNSSTSVFNTSPAAVTVISQQTFQEQGALGLARVLEEQPGIFNNVPGTSGNTAGRTAYLAPYLRDGFGTETDDLLDGHSVGNGDNGGTTLPTFLSSWVLGSTEIIAGPGATAPEIYSAVNGTINYHTLDPTSRPLGMITFGVDGYGGQWSNYRLTGTTLRGKLGYAFDYVIDGTPGPEKQGTQQPTIIPAGTLICPAGSATCTTSTAGEFALTAVADTGGFANNIENNSPAATSTLLACCYSVSSAYLNRSTLAKLRYNFSPNTSLTASFLGIAFVGGENSNADGIYPTSFIPGAAYNPSATGYQPNTTVPTLEQLGALQAPGELLNRLQPTYQAEFRTGNTTNNFLARYWQSEYEFFITQGTGTFQPDQPWTTVLNLYGTNGTHTFNGPTLVTFPGVSGLCLANTVPGNTLPAGSYVAAGGGTNNCGTATNPFTNYATPPFGATTQFDHMHGGTFEYDHFFPNSDTFSVSYDQTQHAGQLYGTWQPPAPETVPPGAWLNENTIMARGILNFGKLNATLANYVNFYRTNFSTNFTIPAPAPGLNTTTETVCGQTVTGVAAFSIANPCPAFQRAFDSYDAPRIGLTYRADPNLALRASSGASLVPVFLSAIDVANTSPVLAATGLNFTNTASSGTTLKPETAWGYDLGFDWRLGDGVSVISTDVYQENLQNQLWTVQSDECYTPSTGVTTAFGTGCGTPSGTACTTVQTTSCPLFTTTDINAAPARYRGITFSYTHDPQIGFGYKLNAALMQGYPISVPPCFLYGAPNATCTGTIGTNNPIPTNLSAIGLFPGMNFGPLGSVGVIGTAGGAGAVAAPGPGGDVGAGFPYSMGFLDVHFRTAHGGLIQLTDEYYGNNNSFDLPAFMLFGLNVIFPIYDRYTTVECNVVNLGDIDNGIALLPFQGVGIPLSNGRIGLSNAYPLGPRRLQVSLTHQFDFGVK